MIVFNAVMCFGALCPAACGSLALQTTEQGESQYTKTSFAASIQTRKTPVKGKKDVKKDKDGAVKLTNLDSGVHSGIRSPRFIVIRSEKDWQALLSEHLSGRESKLPKIDFKQHDVVAYFMGTKSTGGYSVQITGIDVTSGKAAVNISAISPPPGSMTIQILTAPYAIVLSEKLPATVTPVVQEKSGK